MPKNPKAQHMVPSPRGGLDVKRGGTSRASNHHDTKREAVDTGRKVTRAQRTKLRTRNEKGRIAGSDSHGGDPCPPKG